VAAVEIIDSRFLEGMKLVPPGSDFKSAATTLGRRLFPREVGMEWYPPFSAVSLSNIILKGLSGGLELAAVATANAEAAEAVEDLLADARLDVTTTPALLDIMV